MEVNRTSVSNCSGSQQLAGASLEMLYHIASSILKDLFAKLKSNKQPVPSTQSLVLLTLSIYECYKMQIVNIKCLLRQGPSEARETLSILKKNFDASFIFIRGLFKSVLQYQSPSSATKMQVSEVMAAIAIMVMFLKAVYLSRCRGATDRFIKAYRAQVSTATSNLDVLLPREKAFVDSPLFRIYKQGLEEVRGRLSPSVGAAAAGLGEKALNTIRATLDATAVRENQRLNSLLVLLTIAISGGPFIGLLGTVVGVMVTFAAIAATGDINIAAIAPGMAAALLATVAGLGVAIPSLFGYNYLSVKAKDVTADMRVFADEFVAKLSEVHGV